MDEGLSEAVIETFVRLHDEGLIYRGQRLVNWDPVLKTAISDLEVISEEENGILWSIAYPLSRRQRFAGGGHHAPGNHARRYRRDGASGRRTLCASDRQDGARCRCRDREIPIIADDYVDREFGTGVVKVTPAHDFNDYAVGQRHDLPMINILTPDARINDNAPEKYRGLDVLRRAQSGAGRLDRARPAGRGEEAHKLQVPRGDRTGQVIEPYLTDQWFVKMDTLGAARPGTGRKRQREIRAGKLDQHLPPLDGQYPGLVHFAPALVGPSHSGLVRRRRQHLRRPR